MAIACDRKKTEARLWNLERYFDANAWGADAECESYRSCKASHSGRFFEGQLHHIGRFYDLAVDGVPLRIVVVGQEYGHCPARVGLEARHERIMRAGNERGFKAEPGLKARNPHMRGTTSVLRMIFGVAPGTDRDSEFVRIGRERVHVFDAFSLVNYLLCSAVSGDGGKKGLSTKTMRRNCQGHFSEALRILEPSVAIVQGKGIWKWVAGAFDTVTQEEGLVYKATLGPTTTLVARFSHPSAPFPHNWGANAKTPYLLETVAPAIAVIRRRLGLDR